MAQITIENENTSQNRTEVMSINSSVELKDALVDDTWFWQGETHSTKPTGEKWLKKWKAQGSEHTGGDGYAKPPFYVRWFQSWQERKLLKRLDEVIQLRNNLKSLKVMRLLGSISMTEFRRTIVSVRAFTVLKDKFDMDEVKTFVAQKLFKVDGIICDEQAKLILIEKMVIEPQQKSFEEEKEELTRRYGSELVKWINDRLIPCTNQSKNVLDRALRDFSDFKQVDPLSTWFKQTSESTSRMLDRIQNLAKEMASMVKYSFLVEPGSITPHLSEFVGEFRQLETFFERNEMTPEESSHSAFTANYLTKSRSPLIECTDATRVILRPTESGMDSGPEAINRTQQLTSHNVFFNDDDVPTPLKAHTAYGTSDFIHASYVRGGPLLNTFICTQAPMMSTMNDFWQMVWQERSNYIIMLCGAFDLSRMGPLDSTMLSVCPYYWPRMEGEERLYGDFMVRNERVDGAMDPLFNVTYLSVWRADDTTRRNVHLLQHWQYDWTDFSDSHWPLRVLRRARLSPTPTIVQCMDGCGRSGTLVCIEALLMHVLRGSARYDKLILTTALFVRLQRRHSIATPLQYLFIYRTLLYWMQPYITSISQRFYLGLTYPQWGFVGKYNKLVAKHAAGSHYYFA